MYISIYIYIYILTKKDATFCILLHSFAKEQNGLAFFYVLCKRTSRSFMFFAKERCILCALFCSLEKNKKERIVPFGFISHQKLKKRMEKKVAFFKRAEKNETFRQKRMRCPTLHISLLYHRRIYRTSPSLLKHHMSYSTYFSPVPPCELSYLSFF